MVGSSHSERLEMGVGGAKLKIALPCREKRGMTMKIAIIGTGVIGKVHAEVLSELGTPAAALCDLDYVKAEGVRDEYAPDAVIYTDWQKMLTEFRPDAVHICTPHDLHAIMTVTALKQNVNVLCEKPLCIKTEDIATILDAERQSSARLGVCHQNRYNTVNRFLKEYLADKEIIGAHASVVWSRTESYYASSDWRGKIAREGGSALINQALHTLDLMMWICGEPERVAAVKDNLTLRGKIETEDTIALRCFGKTDFTFFTTVAGTCGLPVQLDFMLKDEEYVVVLPKTVLINGKVVAEAEISRVYGKECYGDGHIRLIEDYYRCLDEGKPFAINGEEGARVVRLILGAYQSNGETITL